MSDPDPTAMRKLKENLAEAWPQPWPMQHIAILDADDNPAMTYGVAAPTYNTAIMILGLAHGSGKVPMPPERFRFKYLYAAAADGSWIQCGKCNLFSYHPKDVEETYCVGCHRFHRDRLGLAAVPNHIIEI